MNIKNFIIIALFSFTWMSCGQDLADLNVDPNNSATARPQEVLTSGQVNYANVLDAIMNQNCALYAQYWAGGPGVAILDHERYFLKQRILMVPGADLTDNLYLILVLL